MRIYPSLDLLALSTSTLIYGLHGTIPKILPSFHPNSDIFSYLRSMSKLQQLYHNPHVHKLNVNGAWGKANKPNGVLTIKYNALDQKVSQSTSRNDSIVTEYFVYDPSGNVLASYGDTVKVQNFNVVSRKFSLHQLTIYGSSRIGLIEVDSLLWKDGSSNIATVSGAPVYSQKLGLKRYELNNHLGNVTTVVSDRKLVDSHSNGQITAWKADVISVTDYYPFGMKIEERSWNTTNYRYNFNGKDFFADWNRQDYGFRAYDPRTCRFLSIDPLHKSYPWNSTYAFAENTPIQAIDLEGKEVFRMNIVDIKKYYTPKVVSGWFSTDFQLTYKNGKTLVNTSINNSGPKETWGNWNVIRPSTWTSPFMLSHLQYLTAGTLWNVAVLIDNNRGSTVTQGIKNQENYRNTFLHFTGSVIYSLLYGESNAKYVQDIHERDNAFLFRENSKEEVDSWTDRQRLDRLIDPYTDLINNEMGRKFGSQLKKEFNIEIGSWTKKDVTNLLNRIQDEFTTKAKGLKFKPVQEDSEVVTDLTNKINNK